LELKSKAISRRLCLARRNENNRSLFNSLNKVKNSIKMRDLRKNNQVGQHGYHLLRWAIALFVFGIICICTALVAANFDVIHKMNVIDITKLYRAPIEKVNKVSESFQATLKKLDSMNANAKSAFVKIKSKNKAEGTGFFISSDGYVLTNGNLVSNSEKVNIITDDEREFEAKLIGIDPKTDIALLKINDSSKFPYFELDKTRKAQIGDWIIPIGEPVRFNKSATDGITPVRNMEKIPNPILDEKPESHQPDKEIDDTNIANSDLNSQSPVINETNILDESNSPVEINLAPKPEKPIEQSVDISKIEQSYKTAILKKVDENKIYPPVARRLGHDGRVLVSFAIKSDGSISDLSAIEGTKHSELIKAALDSVRHSSPFNPIPVKLNVSQLRISFWITFELTKMGTVPVDR